MPEFSPYVLREQFPSLSLQIAGRPAVFLDGPGGTQTVRAVMDAMCDYFLYKNSNRGGVFETSRLTREAVAAGRQAMADFYNASGPEEIVFGQNMTSLTFAASRAISRTWGTGDEIIVTRLDHDANISPWLLAAEERGVKVRWFDIRPEDCTLDMAGLADLLGERTRLVAVTHASNAVGTIPDVARVVEMAHQVGALVYVDAVHYAPHGPIDVQALDCDFLTTSSYKYFGPHTGIMYGKYELLDILDAYKVRPASAQPPDKWETGTQSFESIAGVTAAIDYLEGVGKQFGRPVESSLSGRRLRLKQALQATKAYEETLSLRFLEGAAQVPGLRVYGITDVEELAHRAPTFAVSLQGYSPRQVAQYLADQGIFVWDGHYFAVAVMERLGLLEKGGLVRIGFVHYNTPAEVDRTIGALKSLAEK